MRIRHAQLAALGTTSIVAVIATSLLVPGASSRASETPKQLYETSHNCTACHNGLTSPKGEDVSIAASWRASMMANSGRDPYWQASVRREVIDRPVAAKLIEDECSTCHMPMMRSEAHNAGGVGTVLSRLPLGNAPYRADRLAADGVSCTVCHQITDQGFGRAESFNGGFKVDTTKRWRDRVVFGPHEVDSGRALVMHSSSEFQPTQGKHLRASELCATCHTLFTEALDANGKVVGRLPEQVPYQEWQQSRFANQQSCQGCHMPNVVDSMPFSRVWGQQREGLARHEFRGGNFFMIDMLRRYRDELAVEARPEELERGVALTKSHLASSTATVALRNAAVANGRVNAEIVVTNLAGHKFPTAYPSRRAWLHITVTDADGRAVFESGAVKDDGSIDGNDNDASPTAFEPHHREVRARGDVQIYESIMADAAGAVTTGLLSAVRYTKDNRLLPAGFNKANASADVAVHGDALQDPDFVGGSDVVRLSVDGGSARGPFTISAELRFQPIGHRWAVNLAPYKSDETARFSRYYSAMSASSSVVVARATTAAR